jgi:hypothetical protein
MMRSGTAHAEAVLGGEPIWVVKRKLQRRSFTYIDAAVPVWAVGRMSSLAEAVRACLIARTN